MVKLYTGLNRARFFRRFPRLIGELGFSIFAASALLVGVLWLSARPAVTQGSDASFTFYVTSDMRFYSGPDYDSPEYFAGAVEAIDRLGKGAFMVTPGDMDPLSDVYWTLTNTLGLTYTWYPVIGNHELPGGGEEETPGANLKWLNAYDYGDVNPGPASCPTTTFSFDYQNAHFVMLNEYCDDAGETAADGDISDYLYDWLVRDLNHTDQTHIFVFGHEPAFPQPDAESGRLRHVGESLDKHPDRRDRFWALLKDKGVVAYFCGHTHNYSVVSVDGVWQVDSGHARGVADTDAPSTFVKIEVEGHLVRFEAYRDAHDGVYDYDDIIHRGNLGPCAPCVAPSFQDGGAPTLIYTGTQDTYLDDINPDTNYGDALKLELDGSPRRASILRWDVSNIPPGNTVVDAFLTFSVTGTSVGTFELYEMKRPWVETEATWNEYAAGQFWQEAGAQGEGDRGSVVLGTISPDSKGSHVVKLNRDGIDLVQRWVDDASSNQGIIIVDYEVGDGAKFSSSEVSVPAHRPKLTAFVSVTPGAGGATLVGPEEGFVRAACTFTVAVDPVSAILPITYVWQTTGQAPVIHDNRMSLTDAQSFVWVRGGGKDVTVTAFGVGGSVSATRTIKLDPSVRASFSTTSTTCGFAPLTVAFVNTSRGEYDNSLWHLGDGVTSSVSNPVHTFTAVNVYTVTLIVSGPGGSDVETKPRYVTVLEERFFYLPLVIRDR